MTHIDEFRAQAANVLEEAKKQVLAVMDEIDTKVKSIQKDLEAANKDKSKLDAQLAACRKQIEWINSFKKNLAEILSV
jgi:Tfp pilus assembly protein FimV